MSAADTLVQFGIYGSYDVGIHNFLKGVLTPVEPTLIILQSSPMRAFADAAAMLAKGMDNPGLLNGEDLNRSANVPLPLISVTPGAPSKRENQRTVPMKNLFRTDLPGTDPKIRERWVAKPPVPVWLNYQVELWTKTRSTMNALVTALQLKFDPYMAWGVVEIDDWFWGSLWMPIHLDGMTDNSELEAGEEDRLLRHTVSFRVEAWAFHPPEKDLTVHKTTVEMDPSHLEGVFIKGLTRFSSLYFQSNAHRLFQVALSYGGKLNVIPVGTPPNPVTHYFGEKLLFFPQGLFLDQIADNGNANSFLVNGSSSLGTSNLSVQRSQSSLASSPPLLIGFDQQLLIGAGSQFYTQVRLHRSLKLLYKSRYLPEENLPPVPPPLPYEVLLPK
jgi:hypothetical protein